MAGPVPLDRKTTDRILRAVDDQAAALVELTRGMISCRTDSQSEDNPEFPGEARRCQEIVASWLACLGAEVQRWEEPPFYPVVAARLPGSGTGRSLAFNGHVDVVPGGERTSWSHDPWAGEVADGKLWGRGTADMKEIGRASCRERV